ncbi:MAG: extracellular solute-binding protein [Thermomicrobiales bacterium]
MKTGNENRGVRRGNRASILMMVALFTLAPVLGVVGATSITTAQDATEITMWFDTTGGAETADCMVATAIDTFNDGNDSVTVNATLQANNWTATQTAIAGGGGPDIVTTPGPSFAIELAKAGQLAPLDEVAVNQGWTETFVPWALDLGKVDGVLYSIPTEVETLVLYYNKTLFEANGWQPPVTMDDLVALSAQIDEAGIIPFAHANLEWRPTNEWFVGEFLNHIAGPELVYGALTGEVKWTDPAFVQAIETLDQMQQQGWFMGGLDRYYTTTTADTFGAMADGGAAMKIEGTWAVADLNTYFGEEGGNDSEWDWVPMPSSGGEAIYDLGIGSTYSINRASENPDAAAEFLSHLFSPDIQARLAVDCGLTPAPVALPENALEGLDPRYAAMLADMNAASAAGDYGYTTWTFWPPQAETYLIDSIERVWSGDMTAEEYLAGMQQIFDQERAEGSIPPLPERAGTPAA